MSASLPPLHWVNPQNKLGLSPAFWRLKQAGRDIFDHGFLDPPLDWIQGVLGPNDYWVLCVNAYELLQRACEVQIERDFGKTDQEAGNVQPHGFPSGSGLGAKDFARYCPHLQWPSAAGFDAGTESFKPTLNLKIAPAEGSGIRWHLWCQRWQGAAMRHSPHFRDSLKDPYWLIQSSYLWISGILKSGEVGADEFSAAFTALGLGALGAFPRIECDLCFRLAMPQRLRCRHHCVTKMLRNDGDTKNIQNSAEARRACKHLNWPEDRMNFRLPGWPGNEEVVLCGLLWPIAGTQLPEKTQSLTSILKQCPNVLMKLPPGILNLDANQILRHLRLCLDDSEWNIQSWMGKLIVAEEWFAALKSVAPGRPKVTAVNLERFQLAKAMLAQGRKKFEIARAIGVSPSNLSNILRSGETKLK